MVRPLFCCKPLQNAINIRLKLYCKIKIQSICFFTKKKRKPDNGPAEYFLFKATRYFFFFKNSGN